MPPLDNLQDLKKLPPEERIKKLKEITQKNKEEIEKAQKLIKESEEEKAEEEEAIRKIPIPQLKAIDISNLFTREEKEIFAVKRFIDTKKKEEALEEKIKFEKERNQKEESDRKYQFILSQKETAEELYSQIKSIYENSKGDLSDYDKTRIDNLSGAIQYKIKAMQEGSYTPSEQVKELLSTFIIEKYKR